MTVVDETGQSEVLRRDNALLRVDQVQKYFPINGGGILKKKVGDVRRSRTSASTSCPARPWASSASPAAASPPPAAP